MKLEFKVNGRSQHFKAKHINNTGTWHVGAEEVFSNSPAVFVEDPVSLRSQPVIFACNFFLLTTGEDKPQLFDLRFEPLKWNISAFKMC